MCLEHKQEKMKDKEESGEKRGWKYRQGTDVGQPHITPTKAMKVLGGERMG